MNANQKTRILRKVIRKIGDEHHEWCDMDLAMDGSSDCSSMIYGFHQRRENERQEKVFAKVGMTRTEYNNQLDNIIKEEAKHLIPKTRYDVPLAYNDLCLTNQLY